MRLVADRLDQEALADARRTHQQHVAGLADEAARARSKTCFFLIDGLNDQSNSSRVFSSRNCAALTRRLQLPVGTHHQFVLQDQLQELGVVEAVAGGLLQPDLQALAAARTGAVASGRNVGTRSLSRPPFWKASWTNWPYSDSGRMIGCSSRNGSDSCVGAWHGRSGGGRSAAGRRRRTTRCRRPVRWRRRDGGGPGSTGLAGRARPRRRGPAIMASAQRGAVRAEPAHLAQQPGRAALDAADLLGRRCAAAAC